MSTKTQIFEMVERIPEGELPILLEIVRRFVPDYYDDVATKDDIAAHEKAMAEYAAGQTVSHEDIDWD